MRITKKDGNINSFKPFDVCFTVETEAEAKAMYAIFNYAPNTQLLPKGLSFDIKELIGDYSTTGEISNGVSYSDFYRVKR